MPHVSENCTYILLCSDGSLYTGWTNSLPERIAAHNAGKGAKYTRARRPVRLVHVEVFGTKEEAMRREAAIKRLTRAEKQQLLAEEIPERYRQIRSDHAKGGHDMSGKIVQTAGREQLGEFAPMFAHLNDDVLFGEVWNQEAIDLKTKCIITVVSLMASGITDSSLTYHLQNAKARGVTKEEIAAVVTHAAMYVGWPKAWAVFRLAKEVWTDEGEAVSDKDRYQKTIFFEIGGPNPVGQYFSGRSFLHVVSEDQVPIYNVTFEPGCRNNWHIHHAASGGGQILICVGGRGYYQEWGKEPVEMTPGTVVNIPPEVKHWHGAAPDSWFSHLAVEVPGTETGNEWLEAVKD